jgi:hypothetical protein
MGRNYTAMKVRQNKEEHPELYCPAGGDGHLYRTGGNYDYCPRHIPKVKNESLDSPSVVSAATPHNTSGQIQ